MTDQPDYKTFNVLEQPLKGRHLVEASAGTGKTYNITALYLRLIIERDLPVRNILVVTFTKAATEELKGRILQRLHLMDRALQGGDAGEDQFVTDFVGDSEIPKEQALTRVHRAIRQFDEAAVYTIHGFCQRALQEFAFETGTGSEFELLEDGEELLQEVADDLWRTTTDRLSEDELLVPLIDLLHSIAESPDQLLSTFKNHIGKPYLKLEPAVDTFDWPREKLENFSALWGELAELWGENGAEIREIFYSDALKGNIYVDSTKERRLQAMGAFLNAPHPGLNLIEGHEFFTDTKLKQGTKKNAEKPEHPFFHVFERYVEAVEELKVLQPAWTVDLFRRFRDEVERRKERLEVMDYDDMLNRLLVALRDESSGAALAGQLQGKYQAALIDEFQDTDPVQYEIFDRIYPKDRDDLLLYLIGDPKQSIYGFRGADVYAYLEARNALPADHCYTLPANFRSEERYIESLNRLFGEQEYPFWNKEMKYHQVEAGREHQPLTIPGEHREAPLRWIRREVDDDLNVGEARRLAAEWTADEIQWLLNESGATMGSDALEGRHIAVLVRTHDEADLVHHELKERDIGSVRYTKQSVFATEEARYLQELLQAVAEPADESLIRAALSNQLIGLGAKELYELREDDATWLQWLERFRAWNEAWSHNGVANMLRSALQEVGGMQRISEGEHGERKITNILHLMELLQAREREGIGRRRLMKWLIEKREDPKQTEGEELRLESDENLVKIVTIHRSKGLEYPIVFCPFLWDGPEFKKSNGPLTYHRNNGSTEAVLDFRQKEVADEDGACLRTREEALSEELRLAYVALTRAGYRCYLTWMDQKRVTLSPPGCWLRSRDAIENELKNGGDAAPDPGDLFQELNKKVSGDESLFTIQEPRKSRRGDGDVSEAFVNGKARLWEGPDELKPGWMTTSFTRLAGAGSSDVETEHDYDGWFEQAWTEPERGKERVDYSSIFDFPSGASAGTCLHNIFEELDFTQAAEKAPELIHRQLEYHGFDEAWAPLLERKLNKWLDVSLDDGISPFRLNQLERRDTLRELEFTYPVGPAQRRELLQIIRAEEGGPMPPDAQLEQQGFMKGFIDLIVRHNGRYFIIDYKSNHLGDAMDDYRPEALRQEVLEDSYDLQYHIYTVALVRYMQSRPEPFDYEQQFGGIYYLFLRGLEPGQNTGIHYARPSWATIEQLNNTLKASTTRPR